jgi:hypothetical protein
MTMTTSPQPTQPAAAGPRWRDLYRLAAVAALVSELVILLGLVTYFTWPYAPGARSTESILATLQTDPFGGTVSLDLFLFVGNLFSVFVFLALYLSLKEANESLALIAVAFGLIGVVLLVPSRPIIEMFALSGKYAVATTGAAKSQIVAAADALLAQFDGVGWAMNTLLGGISLAVSSYLMLRSRIYGRATAIVGQITNVAVCFFFLPVIGKLLLFLSLPGYVVWYAQLAIRFLQLARPQPS